MSYDQRPGKLRVVQEHAGSGQRRGEQPPTSDMAAAGTVDPANPGAATPSAPAAGGLPVLGAALFLLACAGGGVALAVIRPFGIW
ncbi:hypothetical protein [Sphingomonas hengshuiensis]|uniref:Uncharacterized protein n=1 Tax=Sphingomonas hengshuiensis TaxID=1609977 RepID=A0A7U4J8J2_9SPHN|nr:hypothetical protein [Sphingomonas hengshuiensis]AJP72225.1 hypothetical protein TS85_11135 [Sphingomonas hengshuiensis]